MTRRREMMTAANPKTSERELLCSWCDAAWLGTQYVQLAGSSTLVFCSEDCLRAKLRDDALIRRSRRRRTVGVLVLGAAIVGAFVTPHEGPPSKRPPAAAA